MSLPLPDPLIVVERGNIGDQVAEPHGVQRNFEALARLFPIGPANLMSGGYVTSLPSSPQDGQECFYVADATNGVVWHLKYRAADPSATKWQFVGGAALYGEQSNFAMSDATTSTTFVAPPTNPGPSITVPLAGDYDVTIAGQIVGLGALSVQFGASAASDDDSVTTATTAANELQETTRRKTGVAASTGLNARIRSINGASTSFIRRRMFVVPVRVG